jgi:hypothetical protein
MGIVSWHCRPLAVLIFFLPLWPLYGQPVADSLPPVRVLDMGLVFPNYRWELDQRGKNELREKFGDAYWREISVQAQESAWPLWLRTRTERDQNRDALCDLKGFLLSYFSSDNALLWFPSAKNAKLPARLQPQKDFYLIVRKSGLEVLSPDRTGLPANLEAQLDVLLRAYLTGFSTLTDSSRAPIQTLDGEQWATGLLPEGARSAYVERTFDAAKATSFVAVFPPVGSLEDAAAQFQTLVQRISGAAPSICPLVRSRVANAGNPYYVRFFAHDFAGDMDPRFRKMVLTVELMKSYDHTARREQPVWYPLLTLR